MDDDLEDYKLETAFHPESNCVVHTSWIQDRARGLPKARVENKWYRKQGIGTGCFGSVHLEVMENGEQRAVKKISKRTAREYGIDYKRELAALSLLTRNKFRQQQIFVEFHGWYEDVNTIFLAMEYFPHSDLSKHLNGEIEEKDAKVISRQLLEGLQILHDKGFTHRDIKPQNIFVVQTTPSWWVKIGDFGISKRVKLDAFTELRTEIGTPGYEAPEIRDGNSSIYTNAVDMWSFGCVIYQVIALELPFLSRMARQRYCNGKVPFPDGPLTERMSAEGMEFLRNVLAPEPWLRPKAATALDATWLRPLELIVGIYLGTRYCAVSWVASWNQKEVNIVTRWPHPRAANTITVPPVISYVDGKVKTWGYHATLPDERSNRFINFFNDELRSLASSRAQVDGTGQEVIDFLEFLWAHAIAEIRRPFGDSFLGVTVKAVIPMPGMLSYSAQNNFRALAMQAGIPADLYTLTFSEAAAFSLVRNVAAGTDWLGKTFILCEATKREMNVTSYAVEKLHPLELCEVAPSSGDLCGSDFTISRFERHLQQIIGFKTYHNFSTRSKRRMMSDFLFYMRNFRVGPHDFLFDLSGVEDDPQNGIRDEIMTVKSSTANQAFFDPFAIKLTQLLSVQLSEIKQRTANSSVDAVFIFGDFEAWYYLVDCARNWGTANGITIIEHPDQQVENFSHRSLTTLSRGAALAGLENRGG